MASKEARDLATKVLGDALGVTAREPRKLSEAQKTIVHLMTGTEPVEPDSDVARLEQLRALDKERE